MKYDEAGIPKQEYDVRYEVNEREGFHWQSAISWKSLNHIVCRGYDTNELAERASFIDMMFLLFQGRLPGMAEERMLSYAMVAFVEHAFSPSVVAARAVASGRPLLTSAVAAGIMTFGTAHGPGWQYSETMQRYMRRGQREGWSMKKLAEVLIADHLREGKKIMGLHQPQHVKGDPRSQLLLAKAKKLGVAGPYVELQEAVGETFFEQTGKRIHPNILGAAGSVLLDLGFDPLAAWALGFLSRAFSCAAHAIEEMTSQSAWRASRSNPMIDLLDLALQGPRYYTGPPHRHVPTKQEREQSEQAALLLTLRPDARSRPRAAV
jgi:citryl-CoA lyase